MADQASLELGLGALKAGKIDEAVQILERVCANSPEDYRGFNFLGAAYAEQKLFDRAVGAFQTALQLRPNAPSIHFNLGLAYQADGFPDRAREHFERALTLDPNYEKAKEAIKLLDSEAQSEPASAAQACARHIDEPAVGVCSFCRLPVCEKCKVIVDEAVLCSVCAEKQEKHGGGES